MKEEQQRLLKYIGEIFERKRVEMIKAGEVSNKADTDSVDIYAGLKHDILKAGKKIRRIREDKKMTVASIAALTGLTENYIQEIELGMADPYMTEMFEITRALNIEFSSLFEH